MLGNAFCFQFAKHPACSKMGICGRGESSFKEVVMCVVVSGNKIFILANILSQYYYHRKDTKMLFNPKTTKKYILWDAYGLPQIIYGLILNNES